MSECFYNVFIIVDRDDAISTVLTKATRFMFHYITDPLTFKKNQL